MEVLLKVLRETFSCSGEKSAEEIAKAAGLPLFRVRGSVRELVDAGLIESRNGTYRTTEQGKVKIV
jgi:Sugar-specific transcriptional regulator TrmB.